jgi:hypothetical protein
VSSITSGLLKYVGFCSAERAAGACEGPVVKVDSLCIATKNKLYQGSADYYATSVLMVLILQTYLKAKREGRPKIDTNTITGARFSPLMLEFMHRYCRYMTTCVETTKIGIHWDIRRCKKFKQV